MNILITGASGVIGQSLVEMLQKYSSSIDATFYKNKPKVISRKNINFIKYEKLIDEKYKKKYDQIWHFATYGQPAKFMESWREIIKLNVSDLDYLVNLLSENGHFFYASSSEIYGDKKSDESTIPSSDPLSKRAIYTESKRLGEAFLNTSLENKVTFFRICLAYSPNFTIGDNRVIYELIVKGLKNKYIDLLDDGTSERQYIFIKDAIEMMENIAFKESEYSFSKNGVWNISNPNHISILELAKIIGFFLNKEVKLCKKNSNPLHALSRVDISPKRYFDTFGNYKFTEINNGVQEVIESAKKQLNYS